ncbi:MAG: GUN4 domain-containing protein [Aulosira sp. DedQUE10]|nr:GUN4 domain-containing protein [Aulosira sp. DedQUE10]
MSQELNQDDLNTLADLLVSSQKAKAREALCIKIGISYYKELGFIYESSDSSFAITLINHLNEVGNTKAICKLCSQELLPIFTGGKREYLLKEIAVKLNCNQELRHNYPNPNTVKQATSPTPSPVAEIGINPPNQLDGSKSQSKRLNWLTGGAIFLIGLAGLVGFQVYKTEPVNSRYIPLQKLLSEGRWQEADRETADRMWEVAGKWQERSLKAEDFQKLSCEDLRTIDNLWTKYSKQHFGFSIQRRIWQSSEVNSDLSKFISRVGWGTVKKNQPTVVFPITNFSLSAPEGELPWLVTWQGGSFDDHSREAYMSRIITCGI